SLSLLEGGSTSSLPKHLQSKHHNTYKEYSSRVEEIKESDDKNASELKEDKNQLCNHIRVYRTFRNTCELLAYWLLNCLLVDEQSTSTRMML
uniref:Uncharacterized protein n=1 Tax=Romanomermis culicivorax TaxID=13658 RepID=A0A915HVK4_ROMCU